MKEGNKEGTRVQDCLYLGSQHGLQHRPTFLYDYLQPAIDANLIEMTQPESPKSPTQKYQLTEDGIKLWRTLA